MRVSFGEFTYDARARQLLRGVETASWRDRRRADSRLLPLGQNRPDRFPEQIEGLNPR